VWALRTQSGALPQRRAPEVLLTALVASALYPHLAYLHAPRSKKGKPAASSQIRLHIRDASSAEATAPTEAVVHPASVNSNVNGEEWFSPYVCYSDVCFTSKLYARGTSPVPPLAPLIFCGQRLTFSESSSDAFRIASLDGWLRLKVPAELEPLLLELRQQINRLIDRLVERASAGSRARAPPRARREEEASALREQAELDSLTRALLALLNDALIEPLPPPPKPPKLMVKRKKSRKSRSRRR